MVVRKVDASSLPDLSGASTGLDGMGPSADLLRLVLTSRRGPRPTFRYLSRTPRIFWGG